MELQVIDSKGQASGNATVAETVFDHAFKETLVHQVVVAYMASGRAGTRAHKTRAEVSGGGTKPWRQKGTGRARAGSIRSPLWRGGGVTFAARPQDHAQKVNRKMYRAALRSILSELRRQERLLVVNELNLEQAKTKHAVTLLDAIGAGSGRVLLLTDRQDPELERAVRNLPLVRAGTVGAVGPTDLVSADRVVLSRAALDKLGEWLG